MNESVLSNRKDWKVMVIGVGGVKLIQLICVVCDKRVKKNSLSCVGCQK